MTIQAPPAPAPPGEPVGASVRPSPAFGQDVELTCEGVESIAGGSNTGAAFTDRARSAMAHACDALRRCHERGDAVYGLTTGFGPHVRFPAAAGCAHGAGLIAHLGAGAGAPAPRAMVRAVMGVRCQAIAQGASGIRPDAAEAFLDLLRADITAWMPEVGSVGASGDLIPLAHIAAVLTGDGVVLDERGARLPARDALAEAGLSPLDLAGRDALALVNGTSLMSAYAAVAVARSERLVGVAERLTGWAYRLLGCRAQALDPRLHAARGHIGQIASARAIAAEAERHGPYEDLTRPLQEVYSLRCAPQLLGACRDQLDHARMLVEREINGVSDNPVIDVEGTEALHGGNFQGQQIAFASDALNAALVQSAVTIERQTDVLLNPEFNGGAPLLLAWTPGATSGMAGAQITATAVVAEMRHDGLPAATASIPTNGRNQDVVSMGAMAARAALRQTDRLARVLAVHAIGLAQLNALRSAGRAPGRTTPTPAWMPRYEPFREDRALYADIERIAEMFLAA